jgi:hypothetical protein
MECNMRSLNTKLLLTALGILTMFASPTSAQEPYHPGQSGRAVYNMAITPSQGDNIYNMVIDPLDDPATTGGGSIGWNELNRTDDDGAN